MENPQADRVLKIDIDAVMQQRLPRRWLWLARPFASWLKRTVCQEQMNALLLHNHGRKGAEFARGVLTDLGVSCVMVDGSRLPDPSNRRVILVSNHPLGGLDGMALIAMVTDHYGVEPWFLVNDLLMAVEPLRCVFLPVNKHGRQNRSEVDAMDRAMRSDRPVIIFPAGLVSRRRPDGSIADLEWRKKFVDLAVRYQRDVVPMHVFARNSDFFYKFAARRERLGLKFNIEMIYLPREVFRSAGSTMKVAVGKTLPWQSLKGGSEARSEALRIRNIVDSLKPHNQ